MFEEFDGDYLDDLDSVDISFDIPAENNSPEDTTDIPEAEWEKDEEIIIPEEVERPAVDELLELPEDIDELPEQNDSSVDELHELPEDVDELPEQNDSSVDELHELPEDVDELLERNNPELDEMLELRKDTDPEIDEKQDDKSKVKVLTRDIDEINTIGMNTIEDILEAKSDDYRDKGYSEEEITEKLKSDRDELSAELLADVQKIKR